MTDKILAPEYADFVLDFVKRTQHLTGMNDFVRLAKVIEELGEAANALVVKAGTNPRKAPDNVRYWDIVLEYGDVVMTALVAIVALGFDPEDVLRRQWDKTLEYLRDYPA